MTSALHYLIIGRTPRESEKTSLQLYYVNKALRTPRTLSACARIVAPGHHLGPKTFVI